MELKMNLFELGEFKSHSGKILPWKIECDALSESDWECLAAMIISLEKRPFCRVEGIPRGGIPLERALSKYSTGNPKDRIIICDDIWTTGGSFNQWIKNYYPGESWTNNPPIKWVVFARRMTTDGTRALFTMGDPK